MASKKLFPHVDLIESVWSAFGIQYQVISRENTVWKRVFVKTRDRFLCSTAREMRIHSFCVNSNFFNIFIESYQNQGNVNCARELWSMLRVEKWSEQIKHINSLKVFYPLVFYPPSVEGFMKNDDWHSLIWVGSQQILHLLAYSSVLCPC